MAMTSTAETANCPQMGTKVLTAVLIWGLGVAIAAQTGFLRTLYPPLIALLAAVGTIIPVAIYFRSGAFADFIQRLGLRNLTLFHVWRVAAALLFFWYGAHDLLPPTFVHNAGWGDLIAGLLALAVCLLPEKKMNYLVFHLYGLADLVVAVGTGLMFTLLHDPRMKTVAALPIALIPLYGVGITAAAHLMAFDLLRRGQGLRGAK